MRNLLILLAMLLSEAVAEAQDIFFPSEIGIVLEYKTYDKKEKETGMIRYTITNIEGDGENMDITYLIEMEDANKKTLFKEELTVNKKGDKLYVDMSKLLSKVILEKAGDKADNIKISAAQMETPSNLKPGDTLPDSNVEVSMKVGFMNIKMTNKVTDRKVETMEKIAVKAGNFDAYKLSSKVTTNALGIKYISTKAEWIVKGIGMVKSEEYDKKGNLNSYTELVSIKE